MPNTAANPRRYLYINFEYYIIESVAARQCKNKQYKNKIAIQIDIRGISQYLSYAQSRERARRLLRASRTTQKNIISIGQKESKSRVYSKSFTCNIERYLSLMTLPSEVQNASRQPLLCLKGIISAVFTLYFAHKNKTVGDVRSRSFWRFRAVLQKIKFLKIRF